jgi:hypothetical protein
MLLPVTIVIIVMIIYVYQIQISSAVDCEVIFLDDIGITSSVINGKKQNLSACKISSTIECNDFTTGDLILFKANNNANAIYIGNYYTHVGIVYVDNGVAKIFEACGIEYLPIRQHHNPRGIYLTPVRTRISKYKGVCYWKRLEHKLPSEVCDDFKQFINYALENMYYNYTVIQNGFNKLLGERYNLSTNCGELVLLSLIKLQLLSIDNFDNPHVHSLKYVSYIEHLQNNKYLLLVKIVDQPFSE